MHHKSRTAPTGKMTTEREKNLPLRRRIARSVGAVGWDGTGLLVVSRTPGPLPYLGELPTPQATA